MSEEPQGKELCHSEVIRCMMENLINENGHYRYTRRQIEEIVRIYIDSLISALGTGKPVHVRSFGVLKIKAERARKMHTSKYHYIRKSPFTVKVQVRLTTPGRIKMQNAVKLFNHFIDGKLRRKKLT